MATVTLTAAMRANLASLTSTNTLMGISQLRLSTGLKVNSALDNPSSFFAAQGLNDSAGDLDSLLDGMAQNIQAIKTANEGIASLKTLLAQAKALAQTALAQPGTSGTTTSTVSFSPVLSADLNGTGAGNGLIITVGSAAAQNFTIGANQTLGQLVTAINGGTGVLAELVIDTGTPGNVRLKVSSTTGEALTIGTAVVLDLAILGLTAATYGATANISAQTTQYTTLLAQFDTLAADTNYRGKNLINGTGANVTTQFNALNTNKLTTNSVDLRATALSLVTGANFTLGNISTATTGVIARIDAAITTLATAASTLGNDLALISARSDFSTNLIATFKDGANQLVVADKNTEGANLLSLQTSQQLGIQALSIASQSNQSVLRLFQ